MIRINLLGVPTPVAKVPGPPPTAARQATIFVISLLAAGAIVFSFYVVWSGDIKKLEGELEVQRREAERLRQIAQENQKYLRQRQQLEQRINTIQTLQNSRVGPSDFMAALGNTVNRTTDVYLLSVSPEGNRVAIRGQADRVESIANFIAALKRSPSFEDVQLRQYFQDNQYNRPSFKFNLDCVYRLPTASPPAEQAAPGTGRPGGRPGR